VGEGDKFVSRIGFIGLGIMGTPMAAHLAAAGHQVTGYARKPAAAKRLTEAGGTAVGSTAEAVAEAEVVITMLPNHPEVEEVVLGDDGVFANAADGLLFIDMSSIRPETAVELARRGAERNFHVLDAPVSGGQTGAENGTLSIMVGGPDADFAAAKPLFEILGSTVVHVGPHGAGQAVKAANQLVVGGIYALVSEAIVLLEASGVDAKAGLDVLAGGLAANRILDLNRDTMLARKFAPGFRIALHDKDMGIAVAAGRNAGVALPVTGLTAQLMAAAKAMGLGDLDHSALLTVIEHLSGR
jgi:2-hydroxy-3-oxopropionate reductase